MTTFTSSSLFYVKDHAYGDISYRGQGGIYGSQRMPAITFYVILCMDKILLFLDFDPFLSTHGSRSYGLWRRQRSLHLCEFLDVCYLNDFGCPNFKTTYFDTQQSYPPIYTVYYIPIYILYTIFMV
jgi:hypothetical protein